MKLVTLVSFLILLTASFWAYWPGQASGYLLDDGSSLFRLQELRKEPHLFKDYVSSERSGPIGRQLSISTFALEQIFTDGSVATIKRHNIFLHQINGLLVFWFAYLLFGWRSPKLAGVLAVTTTAFWLLSPSQVSTVLYAVQRMAMLSATLVLLAQISYLKWRSATALGGLNSLWLLLAAVFALLSVFAKENGVLAVPLILLLEVAYLQGRTKSGKAVAYLYYSAVLLAVCIVIGVCALVVFKWGGLVSGYESRNFSLYERLLSQPQVLLDYVQQFYVPDIIRMGVFHDDWPVSTKLIGANGGLHALLIWSVILSSCGVLFIKKTIQLPLYCLLFFLGAHSIESSFLSLEMYFEHRNYLPSVALALLPAVFLSLAAAASRKLLIPLVAWITLYIGYILLLTGTLIQVWSSETLLLAHHYAAHPESSRANLELATRLAELGEYDEAASYANTAHRNAGVEKSARPSRFGDLIIKKIALACIAQRGISQEEISRLGFVNPDRPLSESSLLKAVVRLKEENTCPAMDWLLLSTRLAEIFLLDPHPNRASHSVYMALASLENSLANYNLAIQYSTLALALRPRDPVLLLMHLHFSIMTDRRDEYNQTTAALLEMCNEDKLSVRQRDTLLLYIEDQSCRFH